MRHESPFIGRFTAAAATALYLRMKMSSTYGVLEIAGDEDFLGVAELIAYAAGDPMTLYQRDVPGTQVYVANGAITAGAWVSTAAAGKVQTGTGGARVLGLAMTTTTGDNERIEVLPLIALSAIARSSLSQQDNVKFPIGVHRLRVWDAPQTNVVGTPANDDLGLIYNTFGTADPSVETGDLKNAGATSRKVGFQIEVPECYIAGESLTLRLNAGMKTTVASVSATIDAEVTRAGAPSVDICATAATTINSLTAADKDFTLTPTNCVPGDKLNVVLTIAVNDSGTGTAVIGKLNIDSSALLADIKG